MQRIFLVEGKTMRFSFKVLGLLLILGLESQASALPDPKSLEANAINQRRQILRGELELVSEGWEEIPSQGKVNYGYTLRIAFDGNLRREILVRRPSTVNGTEWRPAMTEIRCYGEKEHIWFSDAKDSSGIQSMLNLVELKSLVENAGQKVVDPRILGYVSAGALNTVYFDLDSFIGNTKYKNISIEKVIYKERECWKATKVLNDGVIVRSWFDPEKDWAVSKMEAEVVTGGVTQIDAVESDLAYYEPIKQWFPVVCHRTTTVNGVTTSVDTLRVKVDQFQRAIDRGKFTLAGLNIPKGTRIQKIPSQPGSHTWDGRQIINTFPPSSASPLEASPQVGNQPVIGTLLVAFFAGGTAVCVGLLWKERLR